jgi:hypothetical protein
LDRGCVDADLIGAGQQHFADIPNRSNPSANCERHETLFGCTGNDIDHRSPIVRRSGDIQEHQLIRTLAVVLYRAFNRIAGIPQLKESSAFDNSALGDVETRYDSFG